MGVRDIYGKRLRALREAQGWRIEYLAQVMGVDRSTVGNWEHERRQPDVATFLRLAGLFHVTLDYLCGRTDDKTKFVDVPENWRNLIRQLEEKGLTTEEITRAIELIEVIQKRAGREV